MTKYLIHIGICGFGNQLLGFKESCIIAKYTNRTIITPIFIPHGTISKHCKPFYEFSEIFNEKHFIKHIASTNINSIKHIKIHNLYNIRSDKEQFLVDKYFNLQKKYYNLPTKKFTNIKKHYIKTLNDFEELNRLNDEVLVLIGTFNNVILSDCYKNGCLNPKCNLNKIFKEDYNFVTNKIIFNNYIKNLTNIHLKKLNIVDRNICVFHMRVLDLCNNKSYEKSYNNYNEHKVYNSICHYLTRIGKKHIISNIFLIAPPQYKNISNINIFNTSIVKHIDYSNCSDDLFMLSMIELYISQHAEIFISSPTNTPDQKKTHTRSSFTMHIKNIRDLSNKYIYDKCISDIYKI